MIRIEGIDNQSLEIEILNYQFPEIVIEEYDANWLNIYFKIDSKFGKWHTAHACLLTWEVQEIINWLKSLANYEKVRNEIFFIEPNLTIKKLVENDEITRLRFIFDHELRLKKATGNLEYYDDIEYYMDCDLKRNELNKLAKNFEAELSKFPERILKGKS